MRKASKRVDTTGCMHFLQWLFFGAEIAYFVFGFCEYPMLHLGLIGRMDCIKGVNYNYRSCRNVMLSLMCVCLYMGVPCGDYS